MIPIIMMIVNLYRYNDNNDNGDIDNDNINTTRPLYII